MKIGVFLFPELQHNPNRNFLHPQNPISTRNNYNRTSMSMLMWKQSSPKLRLNKYRPNPFKRSRTETNTTSKQHINNNNKYRVGRLRSNQYSMNKVRLYRILDNKICSPCRPASRKLLKYQIRRIIQQFNHKCNNKNNSNRKCSKQQGSNNQLNTTTKNKHRNRHMLIFHKADKHSQSSPIK